VSSQDPPYLPPDGPHQGLAFLPELLAYPQYPKLCIWQELSYQILINIKDDMDVRGVVRMVLGEIVLDSQYWFPVWAADEQPPAGTEKPFEGLKHLRPAPQLDVLDELTGKNSVPQGVRLYIKEVLLSKLKRGVALGGQ
jgi:hypothetical protein